MDGTVRDERRISLRLFGGPSLEVDRQPVQLSAYQASLLSIVYGHGANGVSRSRVIDFLWEETDGPKQRHRLSQLIYAIRKKTGADMVQGLPMDRLGSSIDEVSCDLAAFQRNLDSHRLIEACSVLDRPFVPLVDPAPTHEFDTWASSLPRSLRAALLQRAQAMAARGKQQRDWSVVAHAAEAALRLDPKNEVALRELMEALSMAGHPREALAQYEAYLAGVNGAAPEERKMDRETLGLHEAICQSVSEQPFGGRPATSTTIDARLCGRDDELAGILTQITDGASCGLSLHLVSGDAGMGKTRLVSEVLQRARLKQFEILTASCSELEQAIPLNAVLDGLTGDRVAEVIHGLDEPWRAVMLSLMPSLQDKDAPSPQPPYVRPGSVPRRLYEAILRVLAELTSERPVILAIDNLQWADETSVSVLEFVTRRWSGGSLVLLLSYRPPTPHPETAASRFLCAQENSRDAHRTVLDDLTRKASLELVAELTKDQRVSESVEERLAMLGCGSPFFLIELTQEHLAGRLERPGSAEVPALPVSVKQIITERLRTLGAQTMELLSMLSVLGREVRLESLFGLMSHPTDELLESIEDLEQLRLVATSATHIGLRHDLIQYTVYSELSPVRRALLHGRIAEHLSGDADKAADELALHFDRAGDGAQALKYAMDAARRAEESGAVSEAINFLTIARRNAENDPRDHEILGRLAHLHYLHRSGAEAASLLALAAKRFREVGELERALTAEVERIDVLSNGTSLDLRDLLHELERIKFEAAENGLEEIVAIALDLAVLMLERAGLWDRMREVIHEAGRLGRPGPPRVACLTNGTHVFKIFHGEREAGLRAARQAVELARAHGFEDLLFRSYVRLSAALILSGELQSDEGREAIAEAEALAERSGDLHLRFLLEMNQGVWLLDIGEAARALARFRAAEQFCRDTERWRDLLKLHLNLGELHLLENDLDEAADHFGAAQDLLVRTPNVRYSWIIEAGPGLVALKSGDLREATIREEHLPGFPEQWPIDPTLPVLFRARMLERRGRPGEAIELITSTADAIKGRYLVYWIRLCLEEIPRRSTADPGQAMSRALEVRNVAARLKLSKRVQQLDRMIDRLS